MNAIIYTRISPRPGETDSLDIQCAELRDFCAARGCPVVASFADDKRSGSELLRPGLQAALAALSKGDVLVVRDLSRFARDVTVALALEGELRRIGVYLATYESGIVLDPTVDELAHLDGLLPRFVKYWADARERLVKNQRTSDRMRQHQRNGRRMGGQAPVGFEIGPDGKSLVPCEVERLAALVACQWHAEGLSLRAIGRRLRREGWELRSYSHGFCGKLVALKAESASIATDFATPNRRGCTRQTGHSQ